MSRGRRPGRPRKAFHELTPLSQEFRRRQDSRTTLTPRMQKGLLAYATAAVPTLGDAARFAGVSYISLVHAKATPAGQALMESAHEIIKDRTLGSAALIQKLSRRAVEVVGGLMEDAKSEDLRLKAASDLLDRNPETSKTQKLQSEVLTLTGKDAQAIAQAMVEAARLKQDFPEATGDFIKVEDKPNAISLSAPRQAGDPERNGSEPAVEGSSEPGVHFGTDNLSAGSANGNNQR